jgi:hypothetical protein
MTQECNRSILAAETDESVTLGRVRKRKGENSQRSLYWNIASDNFKNMTNDRLYWLDGN